MTRSNVIQFRSERHEALAASHPTESISLEGCAVCAEYRKTWRQKVAGWYRVRLFRFRMWRACLGRPPF